MLTGSIASLGNSYVITLTAVNAENGDSLAREQVQAASKEQVLKSLDQGASALRGKLGESLASVRKFATPLEQATTSSLEALQAFTAGQAGHQKYNAEVAIPQLKRAVELDPNFAMAYAVLGVEYSNSSESQLARAALTKAFELRERASEREKLYISAHYYGEATGESEKEIEVYEQWKQEYPRDTIPFDNLSLLYGTLGQPDRALSNALEAMRQDPKDFYSYPNVASAYLDLGRFDEAKAIIDRAVKQKTDPIPLHIISYELAFHRGDQTAMQYEFARLAGGPRESFILMNAAVASCALGKLREGHEMFDRGATSARSNGLKGFAGRIRGAEAHWEAEFGDITQSKQHATEALAISQDRHAKVLAASALALSGDPRASMLMEEMAKEFPADTVINKVFLPEDRAVLALQRKNPTGALSALESSAPYELGSGINVTIQYWPMYLRGAAYLQSGDGTKALAEYKKILDHPGIAPLSPLLPLARLGAGRAYALLRDNTNAKTAYQDLFALWKDADPDIPILKEAKAEYAKLQ